MIAGLYEHEGTSREVGGIGTAPGTGTGGPSELPGGVQNREQTPDLHMVSHMRFLQKYKESFEK